jgi:hypothetical protein
LKFRYVTEAGVEHPLKLKAEPPTTEEFIVAVSWLGFDHAATGPVNETPQAT